MSQRQNVPEGGYGIISKWVLMDNSLSINAKCLYAVLCGYAGNSSKCFPSVKTLSRNMGVSTRTIIRSLGELEEHNLIEREANLNNMNKITHIKYPEYPPFNVLDSPETESEIKLAKQYQYILEEKEKYYPYLKRTR